ncbi:HAMP domain-containing histidine kinase [Pendulispora rubella]|uniref:histidine kinase n=1 Tax=Pendulispora rubella TaxID=2741070 RepID=A0ABZ2L4I4_9BACT
MLRTLRGGTLFERLFVYGVLVVFASFLSAFLIATKTFFSVGETMASMAARVVPELCATGSAPPGKFDGPSAALYRDDGTLRAALGEQIPPPLPRGDIAQLHILGYHPAGVHMAFLCRETAGEYVLIAPPPFPWRHAGTLFLAVCIVVALGSSLPFARSIAKPIEQIVVVAGSFGRGDLSARANGTFCGEVGDLARAFNDMALRIEQLICAEKELLANVSHELRTPLARIRVVLETAQEAPARAQELLHEIGRDLAELEELVENVMASARMDVASTEMSSARLPLRLERRDLCAIAHESARRFRRMHPHRQLELESSREPAWVRADATLMRRVFDNILENACKYSDVGSPILMRLHTDAGAVRAEVMDSGIGIDAEDLPLVFNAFFRSDRSRNRETGGAGLGLCLAKRIVDAHGGSIGIDSVPGRGTTVRILLKPTDDVSAFA